MINTKEDLLFKVKLEYRFVKTAANELGFTSSKDYQRFRNTLLGSSRDLQVIYKLTKRFKKIDTYEIWGIRLKSKHM